MKLTDMFEKKAGVYILRNMINGKYYIGESIDIKSRIWCHKKRKTKQIISKSIQKYGVDNFEVEVYYLESFDKKSLIELEEQLIITYNSLTPNGYNILPKGFDRSGVKMSEHSKLKMSDYRKNRPKTEEHKRNLAIAAKNRVRDPEQLKKFAKNRSGKRQSPEEIEKRRTTISLNPTKLSQFSFLP